MPSIEHDAPMTEIWVTEAGKRYRAYRGNTRAHIEWKLHHHSKHKPELIEEIEPEEPAAGVSSS